MDHAGHMDDLEGSETGSMASSDRSMARSSASEDGGTKAGFFVSFGDETPSKQKPKLNSQRRKLDSAGGVNSSSKVVSSPRPRRTGLDRSDSGRRTVIDGDVNGNNTQESQEKMVDHSRTAMDSPVRPPVEPRVKYSPATGMVIPMDSSVSIINRMLYS